MPYEAPESIEDVKKHFFKKTWTWVTTKPAWIKTTLSIGVLLLLLVAARLNFFGDPYYCYSKIIIPGNIPLFDQKQPIIWLSLSYELEDALGKRPGRLGDICHSGDRLYLSFTVNTRCWISVIGVDSKGIHPIFKKKFSPSLIEKEKPYILHFDLDQTIGNEVYYIIASYEEFDFEKNIRPSLKRTFPEGNAKGPVFSEYELELPENFTYEYIYFRHINQNAHMD